MVSNAFMDKGVETIYQTNAFQLTIEFCICIKTSFSPVVTPSPQMLQNASWVFVSNIQKGGRGG